MNKDYQLSTTERTALQNCGAFHASVIEVRRDSQGRLDRLIEAFVYDYGQIMRGWWGEHGQSAENVRWRHVDEQRVSRTE